MIVLPTEKRFDWKYPPVMLFFIVTANILVFFLYQSSDEDKYFQALDHYQQTDLLPNEWPAYQKYLSLNSRDEQLLDAQSLMEQGSSEGVINIIVRDQAFFNYLQNNADELVFNANLLDDNWPNWRTQRNKVNMLYGSISSTDMGLIPAQLNIINLFSHQFLHGDFMHLLGNMFFLVFCGFAVEAAIGGWLFLALYLSSGLLGGLMYALLDLDSQTPLVGASGAISGVMAMYLGVFRLRKIEFFYWVFIFAGYFRAPALLLLPFYIGKELLDLLFNPDSNVAFMAHAGGFAGGAILLALIYGLKPALVNYEYVEENQDVDPGRQAQATIYDLVEGFRFDAAIKAISQYLNEHGDDFNMALLRFNLSRAKGGKVQQLSLLALLAIKPDSKQQLERMVEVYDQSQNLLVTADAKIMVKLATSLATIVYVDKSEVIFQRLYQADQRDKKLAGLARKLSSVYGKSENINKQQHYARIAEQFAAGWG